MCEKVRGGQREGEWFGRKRAWSYVFECVCVCLCVHRREEDGADRGHLMRYN